MRDVGRNYELKFRKARTVFSEINRRFPTMPFSVHQLDTPQKELGLKVRRRCVCQGGDAEQTWRSSTRASYPNFVLVLRSASTTSCWCRIPSPTARAAVLSLASSLRRLSPRTAPCASPATRPPSFTPNTSTFPPSRVLRLWKCMPFNSCPSRVLMLSPLSFILECLMRRIGKCLPPRCLPKHRRQHTPSLLLCAKGRSLNAAFSPSQSTSHPLPILALDASPPFSRVLQEKDFQAFNPNADVAMA